MLAYGDLRCLPMLSCSGYWLAAVHFCPDFLADQMQMQIDWYLELVSSCWAGQAVQRQGLRCWRPLQAPLHLCMLLPRQGCTGRHQVHTTIWSITAHFEAGAPRQIHWAVIKACSSIKKMDFACHDGCLVRSNSRSREAVHGFDSNSAFPFLLDAPKRVVYNHVHTEISFNREYASDCVICSSSQV